MNRLPNQFNSRSGNMPPSAGGGCSCCCCIVTTIATPLVTALYFYHIKPLSKAEDSASPENSSPPEQRDSTSLIVSGFFAPLLAIGFAALAGTVLHISDSFRIIIMLLVGLLAYAFCFIPPYEEQQGKPWKGFAIGIAAGFIYLFCVYIEIYLWN